MDCRKTSKLKDTKLIPVEVQIESHESIGFLSDRENSR